MYRDKRQNIGKAKKKLLNEVTRLINRLPYCFMFIKIIFINLAH